MRSARSSVATAMAATRAAALFLVLAVAAAAATAPDFAPWPRALSVDPARPGVVSFFAFGDQGTGDSGQRHVAISLRNVAREAPVDFVLLLGDDFYPSGLRSPEDPLFARAFSDVYSREAFPYPFYPVLGNHDHHRKPDALLGLSLREPRWRMPARRYAFEEPLGDGTSVLFVGLDTTPVDSGGRRAAEAVAGLAETLHGARLARWRIAFGHHPFVSSGVHRGSAGMREAVAPVFGRENVDLYLCGHDHILEALTWAGIPQVTSGGGAAWDRATPILGFRPESRFRHAGGGFVRVEVRPDAAKVTFYDADGKKLFVLDLAPRAPAAG